jgi:hypothetical protein
MTFPSNKNNDFGDKLTPNQKKNIQAGIDDLKTGRKQLLSVVMSKYNQKPHDLTVKC